LLQTARAQQEDRLGAVVRPVVEELKRLIDGVPMESRLAPAMFDGAAVEGRVLIRGNVKSLGESVPRRNLEALGSQPLPGPGSGRLELARQLTAPSNPLLARVIVNRVWHHLFGRGIVESVDNFGVLGERPTHPELLDHLADQFVRDGWSLKRLIRALVLTQTYQQTSSLNPSATTADAQNKLLHRMNVKRLQGEAIRDTLLMVSGRLDPAMHGPPVRTYLTEFMGGRGKPEKSGPLDGAGRRSIYLEVRRNFLPPMLVAFDTPTPASTVGRRTVSNVPAQSLALLNDPFIHEQARRWAERISRDVADRDARIDRLFRQAFARPPTDGERVACRELIASRGDDGWADLAHALVNVKEFIYLY
jgi:hypothetical protein